MLEYFSLKGKTALVTGATRGIGKAMAIGLAEAGADIISFQRDVSETATQKAVTELNQRYEIIQCDISNRDSLLAAIKQALTQQPQISILLNAAGIMHRIPAEDYTFEAFDSIMQTNLAAMFTTCRELGKYWLDHQMHGVIVNVASLSSFLGGLNMTAYSASKGGVLQLSKALSNEWSSRGIRVNCIAPGYVETDMNVDIRTSEDSTYRDKITKRVPMGRWGQVDEFKGVTVFLASQASSYVTGECITVDGGWRAY